MIKLYLQICKNISKKMSVYLVKLYGPHGKPRYLSTIPVKDSHLFKIVESVFSFYLKLQNFKQLGVFY